MRFSDSFLDEIRARLPVSEVVRRRVPLKKQGREWRGLSPFNQEKTPSFFVNDQKGFFHDFSSGKHGDIFGFVMETEGLSFPEAVERLATLAGVPLPKSSHEDIEREQRQRTLFDVLELAATFFEDALASARGARARGYLADRGISSATQLEFRMGYAPADRFGLKEHLGSLGVSVGDMVDAGLLIAGEDIPVPYDRFRDRVIIPIHDQRGRVIAFGGRTLSNDIQPKYLNSPETAAFHKGSVVFNFHRARQAAHENESVVVVEGYMDAIAIYQAGLRSVVATMGTSFTEDQIATLWRLAPEPVICFDADRAGVAAAHRSIDRILPILKVGRTFRFAFLQGEKDPDELVRERGIEPFKAILAGSLPLWDVLWEREVSDGDFRNPDSQAALEQRLVQIIGTVRDRQVHTAYFRMSRTQLANLFWEATRSRKSVPDKGLVRAQLNISREGHRGGIQKTLLGMLVHYPDFIDEKSDEIAEVEFEHDLEDFRAALYDLLIMHNEISVQTIYSRLKPRFYEILQEIHGEKTEKRPWGHQLFVRFPILKADPSRDFVSRCIDHFVLILRVEQMADDMRGLLAAIDASTEGDEASARLLELVKDIQFQKDKISNLDTVLAEEAADIRRVWVDPAQEVVLPQLQGV